MLKTIYKLRLFVQETSQYFPLHLYTLKDKEPTFESLTKKISQVIGDRNLNDYHITTIDTNMILCDNESFKTALKSTVFQKSILEIELHPKSKDVFKKDRDHHDDNRLLGLDDLNLRRYSSASLPPYKHQLKCNTSKDIIPVIKPTVLRLSPASLPNITNYNQDCDNSSRIGHIRSYSGSFDGQNDDNVDYRKDSGISLDEPLRKKQRVLSADHPRRLPDPTLSPLPSLRHTIIEHSLHPLEIRRPSTAPLPSPSPISPFIKSQKYQPIGPTLPTISSITSSTPQSLNSQLAPIHTLTPTIKKHFHTTEMRDSRSSFETQPSKRCRASVSSTQHKHNAQSVYLCEQMTSQGKICGQTFRRSYDLSRHQTIHLENRPFFNCDVCGKKFTRTDALRRHERVQGHSSKHRSMSTSALPPVRKPTSV